MAKSMDTKQKAKARLILGNRDGWICHYCGKPLIPEGEREKFCSVHQINGEISYSPKDGYEIATIDHIQPLSREGSNSLDNLVLCCPLCNHKKGNR